MRTNKKAQHAVEQAGGVLLYDAAPATEETEQVWLLQWAEMSMGRLPQLAMLHHIPNGGLRSKSEAARMKAAGVKAGVPDLCLPVPRTSMEDGIAYHGLYIELKRTNGGVVSNEQKKWIRWLRDQGYAVEVCHGWQAASETIEAYLEGRYWPIWDHT